MTIKKRKRLLRLLKHWTRAEIIARHGRFDNLGFADYHHIMIDKENEIREMLYGSSNLHQLGIKWGILKEVSKKKGKRG